MALFFVDSVLARNTWYVVAQKITTCSSFNTGAAQRVGFCTDRKSVKTIWVFIPVPNVSNLVQTSPTAKSRILYF